MPHRAYRRGAASPRETVAGGRPASPTSRPVHLPPPHSGPRRAPSTWFDPQEGLRDSLIGNSLIENVPAIVYLSRLSTVEAEQDMRREDMGSAEAGHFEVVRGRSKALSGGKSAGGEEVRKPERDPVDLFLLECFRRASLLKSAGARTATGGNFGLFSGSGKIFSGGKPVSRSSRGVRVEALESEGRRESRRKRSGG